MPRSPSSDRADVVIVGGGHNGLICGAYLARAGLDVLVLERNSRCGGALFSTERDGFSLEHGGIDHSTVVASTIPDDLGLERHGLRVPPSHQLCAAPLRRRDPDSHCRDG